VNGDIDVAYHSSNNGFASLLPSNVGGHFTQLSALRRWKPGRLLLKLPLILQKIKSLKLITLLNQNKTQSKNIITIVKGAIALDNKIDLAISNAAAFIGCSTKSSEACHTLK